MTVFEEVAVGPLQQLLNGFYGQEQRVGPIGKRNEPEVKVKGFCRFILGLHKDGGAGHFFRSAKDLAEGVHEKKTAQSKAPSSLIHRKAADQSCRKRMLRQLVCDIVRQRNKVHAVHAQRIKTSDLRWIFCGAGNESFGKIPSLVLPCLRFEEIV